VQYVQAETETKPKMSGPNGPTVFFDSFTRAISEGLFTSNHKMKEGHTNFDKIITTATSFDGIDVSLYKSRETGLKVLIANVEVPIV